MTLERKRENFFQLQKKSRFCVTIIIIHDSRCVSASMHPHVLHGNYFISGLKKIAFVLWQWNTYSFKKGMKMT